MTTDASTLYPCPCCGYIVFEEAPGSYDICPICFWEDDMSQLRFVETRGANGVSLVEAQQHFLAFGVSEARFGAKVRPAGSCDRRDPLWRPFSVALDTPERPTPGEEYGPTYPVDRTTLYYWRTAYWRPRD